MRILRKVAQNENTQSAVYETLCIPVKHGFPL